MGSFLAAQTSEVELQKQQSLLASVLHDIRSPLNVIMVAAKVVCDPNVRKERRQRNARLLQQAADSINVMCQDVLDYSKLSSGHMELSRITFHLRDCIFQVTEAAQLLAEKKGIEVRSLVAPDVPAHVLGDPGRLRQVLGNLLTNAVKFTQQGRVEVRVVASQASSSNRPWLRFEVEDTGLGIQPDKLATLFNPFRQAHGTLSTDLGGSGLGLAIAQQLVGCMGGELQVRSRPGKGTCFYFEVPFNLAEARPTAKAERLQSQRVLIWHDQADGREELESLCVSLGMHPVVTGSGPQAIQWLEEGYAKGCPFPLMIFDLQSGGDALFTIEQIPRSRRVQTRFLAVVGTGQRGDMALCQESGIDGYLAGPFDRDLLEQMLLRLCASDKPAEPLSKHNLS